MDMKIKNEICNLMNDVQIAANPRDKNVFDDGYIEDVNNRIRDVETAIAALKNALEKNNLNDW